MSLEYFRDQRFSIDEPATIGDIPFEVIKKGFKYLDREDLLSASLSCRAWRLAAIETLLSVAQFTYKSTEKGCYGWICGIGLKSIVFGVESVAIKSLDLQFRSIGLENVSQIAKLVSPGLSTLSLDFSPQVIDLEFDEYSSSFLHETLEKFFLHCPWIRDLSLTFWDDPEGFSQIIKDGIRRLSRISIIESGDILTLIENLSPDSMRSFEYIPGEGGVDEDANIDRVLMKCRQITELRIIFVSADIIPRVIECCPLLEKFDFCTSGESPDLSLSNIEDIASLHQLTRLEIQSEFTNGILFGLKRCKRLQHLSFVSDNDDPIDLSDVLPYIGGDLVSLYLSKTNVETARGIVKHCANLEILDIGKSEIEKETVKSIKREMRRGLKRLLSLSFKGKRTRRGI
jgi:hypothetical protein